MWITTLFVLILKITPAEASYLMMYVTFDGHYRPRCLLLSVRCDRTAALGYVDRFGAALLMALAGYFSDAFIDTLSVSFLLVTAQRFFGDGSYAIIAPYLAEVWPARLPRPVTPPARAITYP